MARERELTMRFGTAFFLLGMLYLAMVSAQFRAFLFGVGSLLCIGLLCLIFYGADKPQTIFYDHEAHPAFLLHAGDSCPAERHVWNGWCVK
jgi:hypothetical protein